MFTANLQPMRSRFTRVAMAVIVVVALSGGTALAKPGPSGAPGGQGGSVVGNRFNFGVRPVTANGAPFRSTFVYELTPGEVITDRMEVINATDAPEQFYLYAADAYTAPVGGGFAVAGRTDPKGDVATWVTLPVSQYTVSAKSAAVIPFRVTVPPQATPGDHAAGLVAEQVVAPSSAATGHAAIQTVHRVGTAMYVRIAGPLHPALSVERFALRPTHPAVPYVTGDNNTAVAFELANTGNTRVQLDKVTVDVTDLVGRTLGSSTVARPSLSSDQANPLPDELLPGAKVIFTRQFNGLFPLDKLTVHVLAAGRDKVDGEKVATTRTRRFWNFPWLVVLVVLALIGAALWWRRRQGGQAAASSTSETAVAVPADVPAPIRS